MVVHVLSVAFTAAVMYLSVPGTDLFSWHPTCMAVGFVLLANQAIMVFSKESGLFPTSTRNGIYQILAQNNPQSL
jgi:cytochrome b-561 domain-containing protein 2